VTGELADVAYSQSSSPVVLLDCLVLQTKPPVAVLQSTRDEVMHYITAKVVRSCRPTFYCLRF